MNIEEDLTQKIAHLMLFVFAVLGSISAVVAVGLKFGIVTGCLVFAGMNLFLAFLVLRKENKLKQEGK
jgi:hypothetical protein